MKIRSLLASLARPAFLTPARRLLATSMLLFASAIATLGVTGCGQNLYAHPENLFAGRPVPPSQLLERVLVGISYTGTTGGLEILDGLRDIRNNLQNTIPSFTISGYSGAYPSVILNFPEQLRGFVYSDYTPFAVSLINYSTEAAAGTAATLNAHSSSLATTPSYTRFYSAQEQAGILYLADNSSNRTFALNVPNVYKVAVNTGDTVALVMRRNTNTLYRVVKLNAGTTVNPPGAIDCQPVLLPVYCVVPVPGNFDRPVGALFSSDGSQAYVLSCGVECGGGSNGGPSVSFIPQGSLQINLVPTSVSTTSPVTQQVSIPAGITTGISDGSTLYLAGQSLLADGLYTGYLTTLNLTTFAVGTPVAISDGYHSKMLFADDSSLWIGSQYCATGERQKQGLNYNCLTRYDLNAKTATIVPALVNGAVPYPNADDNQVYYGSLTGICWVQNYHKVYTAYGGQIHSFNTADGTERDNTNIIVQGTALDVAYMDALTNEAN